MIDSYQMIASVLYHSLISVVKKLSEEEIIVLARDFNVHEINPEDYEDQYVGYSYGVRSKEGEKILGFCAAMNTTVGNTLFKARASLAY